MSVSAGTYADAKQEADALLPRGRTETPAPTTAALSVDRVEVADWDRLTADFDGICQEMTHVFASHRWPRVVEEPLIFSRDGKPVSAALVMIQRLPLGLASMAVVKWGPALRDETADDADAIYGATIDLLKADYADRRGMMLSVLPRAPRPDETDCFGLLTARGFRRGSQFKFPHRYIVKLGLDEAEQRRSLAQKWRYHLNKSEKEGLSFEHAGPDSLGEFDALYQAMTDRKQFPDHSAYDDTVARLMTTDVDALRPEVFFVRKDGEAVAGALIFKAGRTAVYLYGATNDKALPLRAGYFMHWNIIGWLRDNTEADWYDLGGTDGFQGLHQFKKGMVGSEGLIEAVPPIANYASRPMATIFGLGAYAARDGLMHVQHFLEKLRAGRAKPDQGRA